MPRKLTFFPVLLLSCFSVACASGPTDELAQLPALPVAAPSVTVIETGEDAQVRAFNEVQEPATRTQSVEVISGLTQQLLTVEEQTTVPLTNADATSTYLTLDLTTYSDPKAPEAEDGVAATQRTDFVVSQASHSNLEHSQDVATNEGFLNAWFANPTGFVSSIKLLPPPGSEESGRQTVEQALLQLLSSNVIFPTTPIGIGGVWQVEQRVTGATTMQRTTTYTLKAVKGQQLQLDVAIEQRPARERLVIDNEIAGALDGTELEVIDAVTQSAGSITVDLASPLPVEGEIAATTRLVYRSATADNASHDVGHDVGHDVAQDITTAVRYGS